MNMSLGIDFKEVTIPKESKEEALLYRSKLIESLAELDDRLDGKVSEWRRDIGIGDERGDQKSDDRDESRPDPLWRSPEKPGNSAPDRCHCGLPSFPFGCPAGRRNESCDREQTKAGWQRMMSLFTALAFKVMMDQGRKLVYIRIYSGVLKVGNGGL